MKKHNNVEEKDIPNYFKCPITKELMDNPVIAADGFTYDKSAIEKWLSKKNISPVTGQILQNTTLHENKLFKGLVDTFQHYRNKYFTLKTKSVKQDPSTKKIGEKIIQKTLLKKEDITLSKELYQKSLEHYYKSTLELRKCCEQMKKALDLNPNDFDIILNYANMLRFSCKFDEAIRYIKKLKFVSDSKLIPKYMKIRILTEMGKKWRGIEKLENLLLSNPIAEHTLLEIRFLSYSYLSTDFRAIAERLINAYLSQVFNDPRAISHKIYINLLNEQYTKVIEGAEAYLAKNIDDVSVLFHKAKAYNKLQKKKSALKIYQYINSFSKDKTVKAKCFYESALLRDSEKEFSTMVKELEEAHNLDPEEEADGYLAALYTDKKIYDKAEEWINKCSKRVDIKNDSVYLGIQAQILENNKKYEEAVNSYIRLTEIDSENANYYNQKIDEIFSKKEKTEEEKSNEEDTPE